MTGRRWCQDRFVPEMVSRSPQSLRDGYVVAHHFGRADTQRGQDGGIGEVEDPRQLDGDARQAPCRQLLEREPRSVHRPDELSIDRRDVQAAVEHGKAVRWIPAATSPARPVAAQGSMRR